MAAGAPGADADYETIALDVCERLLASVDKGWTEPNTLPCTRPDMSGDRCDTGQLASGVPKQAQWRKQRWKQCAHFPDCKYGKKCWYEHPSTSTRAHYAQNARRPERRPERRSEATDPRRWTVADVHKWVRARGFPRKVADQFQYCHIKGAVLTDLDLAELKDMGIESPCQRKKLLREIAKLGQSRRSTPEMWEDIGRIRKVGPMGASINTFGNKCNY